MSAQAIDPSIIRIMVTIGMMVRRGLWLVAFFLCWGWTPAPARGVVSSANVTGTEVALSDDTDRADETSALTAWLSQAGLDEILAVVLDEQVRKSTASSPSAIARLSDAYIRLVDRATDEEKVSDLRARIGQLLKRESVPDQAKLRLALGRAEYRMSLKGIERLRQGQVDKDDRARTVASLLHALESLDQLAGELAQSIEKGRLLVAGADEQQRISVGAQVDESSDLLLTTKFIRALCRYWLLWIDRPIANSIRDPSTPWMQRATALVSSWSELLETGKALPEPVDCSIDLLCEEYYAQSILGMAMTKALQSDFEVAEVWFDLLKQRGVWEGLADYSSWYLQALVDTGSYSRATAFLREMGNRLNCPAVVGAAVRAVEESSGSAEAIEFARDALLIAALQGDFGSVRRIAQRVPALTVGSKFSACLARGIQEYDRGRAATDATVRRSALDTASRELALAVENSPPDHQTSASILELLAWSQLGADHRCEASASFVAASNQLSGNRADEALWMAVESATAGTCIVEGDGRPQKFDLAREYLLRFESGSHATSAATILGEAPGAERDSGLVDRLLRDTLREGDRSSTRQTVGSLLYRRFRSAQAEDRRVEAMRLLSIPPAPIQVWPTGSVDIVVRQQLEASLDPAVHSVDHAIRLLELVATKYRIAEEPIEIRSEIAVRRLALAFARRDFVAGIDAIGTIRAIADLQWRPVAEGLFVRGMESMIASGQLTPQQVASGRWVIVGSRRALRDAARKSGDTQRAAAAEIQLGLALLSSARSIRALDALGESAPRGADAQLMSKEALTIARELLANRPDDAQAYTLMADAAMASGDFDAAFEALSRLVGALPVRSDEWFGRKADLCELMVKSNPDEVRKILAQHLVLIPDWGPGAGGERLKALAIRLGVAVPQTLPEKGSAK